jgi:hypothetical protein
MDWNPSSGFDQQSAAESTIEFITGLRQFRNSQPSQEMVHSASEVAAALAQEFEVKMMIVES